MTRLLPRTLFGQTLLTLLVGICLALASGAYIYASARIEAVRAVGALAAAERIVNLSRMIAEVPADWRVRIVTGSNDPTFRVRLTLQPPAIATASGDADASQAIATMLREALPSRRVLVAVRQSAPVSASEPNSPVVPGMHQGPGPHYGPGAGFWMKFGGAGWGEAGHGPRMGNPMARAAMSWRGLDAAVELDGGHWLAFSTALPDAGPTTSPRLYVALLVMTTIIAALTALAVRRMTAPLRLLADAAERLGRDVDAPPLPLAGTVETRRATGAFNGMQGRIKRLIANRTLMLAAISHDLRTQLQLLRLRTETAEETENRSRMLATISDMEAMLTATLSFARDEAASEARKRTDLAALLTSIADDLADAGLPVTVVSAAEGIVAEVKPIAMRRALTNLIDNAVKYGTRARLSLERRPGHLAVIVDDDGPGIPEPQLGAVLEPFVRLEASRNSATGGIGLGLAIAASIAEAHDGRLELVNRPGGGLSAILELPAVSA